MTALERLWWTPAEPAWHEAFLWPLTLASLAYRGGAEIARRRSRPHRARIPVISVGNLCVGGAGKTPVTLALAQRLQTRGLRVAILSRGYGRTSRADVNVNERSFINDVGDEPLLLKRRLPDAIVLVGRRRATLADEAARLGAQVAILDDGLQHHALERDLDIVVADASNPLGNGRLLPRGPLRERPRPIARSLLWLTRADQADPSALRALAGISDRPPVHSAFAPAQNVIDLQGRRAFLFAGIARPQSFEALARKLCADVIGTRWFADHHAFTEREVAELSAIDAELVTTEKDLVRWPEAARRKPRALAVDLQILQNEQSLDDALRAVLP